jgi:hypothetical protein
VQVVLSSYCLLPRLIRQQTMAQQPGRRPSRTALEVSLVVRIAAFLIDSAAVVLAARFIALWEHDKGVEAITALVVVSRRALIPSRNREESADSELADRLTRCVLLCCMIFTTPTCLSRSCCDLSERKRLKATMDRVVPPSSRKRCAVIAAAADLARGASFGTRC